MKIMNTSALTLKRGIKMLSENSFIIQVGNIFATTMSVGPESNRLGL